MTPKNPKVIPSQESVDADAALAVFPVSIHHGECTDGILWIMVRRGMYSELRCDRYYADFITEADTETLVSMLPFVTSADIPVLLKNVRGY